MMVYRASRSFLFHGLLLILIPQVISEECLECKATENIVRGCPQTQEAWEKAAAIKNCGSFPNSCTSFVYHCVMNTWQNEAVEVCAPKRLILGGNCAEYNFLGVRVQRNDNVKCRTCPNVYNSSETYKYPECYRKVETVSMTANFTTWFSLPPFLETTTKRNLIHGHGYFVGKRDNQIPQENHNISHKIGFFFAFVGISVIILFISLAIQFKKKPTLQSRENSNATSVA